MHALLQLTDRARYWHAHTLRDRAMSTESAISSPGDLARVAALRPDRRSNGVLRIGIALPMGVGTRRCRGSEYWPHVWITLPSRLSQRCWRQRSPLQAPSTPCARCVGAHMLLLRIGHRLVKARVDLNLRCHGIRSLSACLRSRKRKDEKGYAIKHLRGWSEDFVYAASWRAERCGEVVESGVDLAVGCID